MAVQYLRRSASRIWLLPKPEHLLQHAGTDTDGHCMGLAVPSLPGQAALKGGGGGGCITPTDTYVHGDALCFLVMGPSLLQRLAVIGGWLSAVPGGFP